MQPNTNITTGNTSSLTRAHVELLRSFSEVSAVLRGFCSVFWLPGQGEKFDGPRRVRGTRPLPLVLEVGDDLGLTLSAAISRPEKGRLSYRTVMRYDFGAPMAAGARGAVLDSNNSVIARGGLNLLTALVRFGEKRIYKPTALARKVPQHPRVLVPFEFPRPARVDDAKLTELASTGMNPALVESYRDRLRQELVDTTTLPGVVLVDSRIAYDEDIAAAIDGERAYESYAPLLGVRHWNPVAHLQQMPNPAREIMAELEVDDTKTVSQADLDRVVARFREVLPLGQRFRDEQIYDALVKPNAPVICREPLNGFPPRQIAVAMRQAAGSSRAAFQATDADLVTAALNPEKPLILSRLTTTQILHAEDLRSLPEPYAGHFLPPMDWQPPVRTRNRVA